MLREFYLLLKNAEADANSRLKHIQYNYIKYLSRLKYISYKRIDIIIDAGNSELQQFNIEWDDGKSARVSVDIDRLDLDDLSSIESVVNIYNAVATCLIALWKKNNWNPNDIEGALTEIEKEKYRVSVIFGKKYTSPDKKHKAEFVCDIFSEYADYYLQVAINKNITRQKIKFLKGTPIVDLFFTFFNKLYWRDNEHFILHDFNKEIFYVFYVNDNNFSIEYRPIHNSQDQLENYVKAYSFGVSTSERLMLLGLKS